MAIRIGGEGGEAATEIELKKKNWRQEIGLTRV